MYIIHFHWCEPLTCVIDFTSEIFTADHSFIKLFTPKSLNSKHGAVLIDTVCYLDRAPKVPT